MDCSSFYLMISHLFCLFMLASSSHFRIPPEEYWHSRLPNTKMPSSIRNLLTSTGLENGSSVGAPGDIAPVVQGNATVEGQKGPGMGGGTEHGNTNVEVGHGGVDVSTSHKGKPITVHVYPGFNPFQYNYGSPAAVNQLLRDQAVTSFFFREGHLLVGAKMKLRFTNPPKQSGFLPRHVISSIPFSSASSLSILRRFSIDPQSAEAATVRETLKICESPAAKGEEKLCATSIEDMVDFAIFMLGTNQINVLTTTTSHISDNDDKFSDQQYIVKSVANMTIMSAGNKLSVTCHRQPYVYAVYYCHATYKTKLYAVELVGEEGREVKAVVVCHEDTSGWSPMHVAFTVLHERPGSGTVCHFLPQDHLVWISIITRK